LYNRKGENYMKKTDVIVIGGSAAGLTAAITSRLHYPDKSVMIIRKEKRVLIPCGIPYIFGTLGSCDKNLIPDTVLEKNEIDLLVDEVTEIHREKKTVITAKGQEVYYDRLVIATGSEPVEPPIPGCDKEGIFFVKKNVPYLNGMLEALNKATSLVIVGCGFIGVELAEECKKNRDIDIKIVEMLSHCLQLTYDEEFSIKAENFLRDAGIDPLTGEKVAAFLGNGAVERVKLSSGKEIDADMVIIGIGSKANTLLAQNAGLEIGLTKGIAVNRYMQTNDQDIFACGDCAEKISFFNGQPSQLKLASIATMEAHIAAANLFGSRRMNMGVIGVYSTVLNNNAFSGAGLTECAAKEQGYNVIVGEAESPNRHPGAMEGMAPLKVKLIFEAGTQVLIGGQAMGAKSAGELINVISACILQRMTADDIAVFQVGTHPGLTASPIVYQLVIAAEMAIVKSRKL
jgi:NADPH-dependent 2,4-dienoyl-CoA reductase/sulfur reductase-like enzyme